MHGLLASRSAKNRTTSHFGNPDKSAIWRRMPKRKEPELTPEEQYKRFKEAAKKAGVTDKEEDFARAFRTVVEPKKPNARRQ
jgi:hypothetical protein